MTFSVCSKLPWGSANCSSPKNLQFRILPTCTKTLKNLFKISRIVKLQTYKLSNQWMNIKFSNTPGQDTKYGNKYLYFLKITKEHFSASKIVFSSSSRLAPFKMLFRVWNLSKWLPRFKKIFPCVLLFGVGDDNGGASARWISLQKALQSRDARRHPRDWMCRNSGWD